jgi:hypothetical protein
VKFLARTDICHLSLLLVHHALSRSAAIAADSPPIGERDAAEARRQLDDEPMTLLLATMIRFRFP